MCLTAASGCIVLVEVGGDAVPGGVACFEGRGVNSGIESKGGDCWVGQREGAEEKDVAEGDSG